MRITLLTTGTRGDTQPYLALGLALQHAGQQVRVAAFENYKSFVTSYGLEFFSIRGDVSMVASSIQAQGAMKTDNPLRVLLSFNKLKSFVFDLQKDFFEACVGADAIVYHPGASIGYFIGQHIKIPTILASPFPITPTVDYPSLIFYDKVRLGKRFNRVTHQIFERIMWFASSGPVRQFWKKEFGKIPENFGNPFPRQNTRTSPTIISCSPHVFQKPSDASPHIHHTGYWVLEDYGWQPPEELQTFLAKGSPPVYIGFGSVGDPQQAPQTTQLVMDALKQSGQRGVLATGWSGMAKTNQIPEEIYVLESAPHTWLFPQMAAVVHHGGAGTTAAGLRAGVPNIVIPHGNDQFAWGRRLHELGVGTKPIPRKNLTAENLAEVIRGALLDEIKESAKIMGEKIRSERGAETAAKIILDCFV